VSVVIRAAQATDLAAVEHLLRQTGLTTAGVADHIAEFLVAEDAGRIVATAGLESYGRAALLRSVASDSACRGRGIPRALVMRLLQQAEQRGVAEVYLLTTTAAGYFQRFGFEPIAREGVSSEVRRSAEFEEACCDTAQAMRLILGAAGGRASRT